MDAEKIKLLRKEFDPDQISQKPKQSKQQAEELSKNKALGINCKLCGQWHHKNTIHLEYVGHAAVTARLLEIDPQWNWEPVSFGEDGSPAMDRFGGIWIRLTILGVTRLGYGSAEVGGSSKSQGDVIKELIGDAIRNAAMRFGVALNLWHKGESVWSSDEPKTTDPSTETPVTPEPQKLPDYPQQVFDRNFQKWADAIREGKTTHEAWISALSNKGTLTEQQLQAIYSVQAPIQG